MHSRTSAVMLVCVAQSHALQALHAGARALSTTNPTQAVRSAIMPEAASRTAVVMQQAVSAPASRWARDPNQWSKPPAWSGQSLTPSMPPPMTYQPAPPPASTPVHAAPAYAPMPAPAPSTFGGVPSQWARNPSQWTQPPAWSSTVSWSAPPSMASPAMYEAAGEPTYARLSAPMSTPSSVGGVPSQWARNPSQWTQPPAWSSKVDWTAPPSMASPAMYEAASPSYAPMSTPSSVGGVPS
eukprot:6194655-Pleurochrysis_carterae.AAC.6